MSDVEEGLYFLDTMVCAHCYAEMQKKPQELCCFGKPTIVYPRKVLGYDPDADECQRFCPDRWVCALIVTGRSL